jgi:NADPH-dependent 2,4-dienoyl-CoA reductase/sulfur reductase-like enzyme
MMDTNRRKFLKTGALLGAGVATAGTLQASGDEAILPRRKGVSRVVVIGGGFGGLSAAKMIKKRAPKTEVVVIEKRSHFLSCPYSNAWLGGLIEYEALAQDYFQPTASHDYRLLQATVTDIDRTTRRIKSTAGTIAYDYLVLAPGIAYDYTPLFGGDTDKAQSVYLNCPPALMPGSEQLALARQLRAVKEGDFIITVPPGVFRCPPAPYERACMVAHWYEKHNIKGRVIIIDPRPEPAAKAAGFLYAFKNHYADRIVYLHSAQLKDVDPLSGHLTIERFSPEKLDFLPQTLPFAVANVIPPIRASGLIKKAGLQTHEGGWAKLAGVHQQSISDDRIFVVGDAQGSFPYPKSGQMASAQGKVVAEQIAVRIKGETLNPSAHLPYNVCYSLTRGDPKEAIAVFHEVRYSAKNGIEITASETKRPDRATAKAAADWFGGIMDDLFL